MSIPACPADFELVDAELWRIITQYRESPRLIFLIRTYCRLIEESIQRVCDLPDKFDINSAVGDQLTILGKELGFPRCHCICTAQPVFGFECEDPAAEEYPITGFCDDQGTWAACGQVGFSEICINDDEIYRKFLKVRIYQMSAAFDMQSLQDCIDIFFGSTAVILDHKHGRVLIGIGRELSALERSLMPLVPRVLPLAPSIDVRFHFGSMPVFGFGDGFVGFCADASFEGVDIANELDEFLLTEDSEIISGFNLLSDGSFGEWACETNVHPYDCVT